MVRLQTALRFVLIVTIFSPPVASVASAADDLPIPALYGSDGNALAQSRQRYRSGDVALTAIVRALQANAEKALKDGRYSVVYKKKTVPGIDLHDYISIAPYTWPNPNTPNHLPYISRDGERNPEFMDYDAQPLMDLTDHAYVLALTGYLTGETRYSHRAAELIRIWFLDPATCMNPNLNHAQMVKGISDGEHGGIIESRRIIMLIDAMEMLKLSGDWSADQDAAFRQWLRPFLQWLITSKMGLGEQAAMNNHGAWCDVQIVTYSIYLGDTDQARQVVEQDKHRLNIGILPDGEMPFEQTRTRSFWYVQFYMQAMTQLADMGTRVGVDLWDYQAPDGSSLRGALDYLVPYATGHAQWIHKEIGGFTGKSIFVPLRRAEAAWHTHAYESAISELKAPDVITDEDREHPLFPPGLNALIFPTPN